MTFLAQLQTSKHFAVAIVTLGVFTDICIYSIIIPIVPFILTSIDASESWIGILLAIYGMGVIIGSLLFGLLVTKKIVSKKWVMVSSLVIVWLSVLLFALSNNVWMLALARLCQGLASCGVWVMGLALIADCYDNDTTNLGFVMNIVMSGLSVGMLAGPPIGGFLYGFSYHAPFIFCAVLVFVDLVGRIMIKEPAEIKNEVQAIELDKASDFIVVSNGTSPEVEVQQASTATEQENSPENQSAGATLFAMFKFRSLWVVSAMCAIMSGCLAQLEPTLPLYLNALYGYESSQIGLVWLSLVLPNTIGGILGGIAFDKYGMRRTSMYGIPICVLGLVVLAIPGPKHVAWTCGKLVLGGFAFGFAFAPITPGIAASVPKEYYALGYALMNFMFSFGIAIGVSGKCVPMSSCL
ncbi:major facilitator superfamily domain-containing protein [Chytriomyces sp. MP71]|nr:major facilitator superfamily domain-containing protein [Chytriomyces sp. MP71]